MWKKESSFAYYIQQKPLVATQMHIKKKLV